MQLSTHPVSQEELMAYLDGELPVKQASLVATHLDQCRECQAAAADLEMVTRRLLDWQIETPSEEMSEPLLRALDGTPQHPAPARLSPKRPWIWVAAAAAAILAIAVVNQPRTPRRVAISTDGNLAMDKLEQGTIGRLRLAPKSSSKQFMTPYSAERSLGVIGGALQTGEPAPPPATPATGPLIIRTATLTLTAGQFDKARGDVERILAAHHGYIGQLTINSASGQARALNATLRVPATELDAVLSELRKLGHVDSDSQGGEDVTQQSVDLDARLTNARNSEQRLTQLLRERTGRLSDVLAVEEQINNVRGQIEQMEAERKSLSNRIAFATLELAIAEIYQQSLSVDQGTTSTKLRNAAVEGYRHVVNAGIATLRFALSYGPILLVLAAILFFPARALWRRRASITG